MALHLSPVGARPHGRDAGRRLVGIISILFLAVSAASTLRTRDQGLVGGVKPSTGVLRPGHRFLAEALPQAGSNGQEQQHTAPDAWGAAGSQCTRSSSQHNQSSSQDGDRGHTEPYSEAVRIAERVVMCVVRLRHLGDIISYTGFLSAGGWHAIHLTAREHTCCFGTRSGVDAAGAGLGEDGSG